MSNIFPISEAKVGVVRHVLFFHGLGGTPYGTWQSSGDPKECWLKWLDEDIDDLAVWTVGYEAACSRWLGSAMHLTDRAANVLERLLSEPRLQTGDIFLVGHSFGGLVIKQLLRSAESMTHKRVEVATFLARIRRVAFLATPHSGADSATLVDYLRFFFRPSAATSCLIRNDPNLRDLNYWYRDWSNEHNIDHLIFTETKLTYSAIFVVKPDSSDPGLSSRPIPIDADHFSVCKPDDRSSEIYLHLREFLQRTITTKHYETFLEDKLSAQSSLLEEIVVSAKQSKQQLSESILSVNRVVTEEVDRSANKVIEAVLNASSYNNYSKELVNSEIERQLSVIRRARFLPGFSTSEEAIRLADKIQRGDFVVGSDNVKSNALAWCARFLSVGGNGSKSDELLNLARQLGCGIEIVVAEAFRVSATGALGDALSKLASIDSPVARSAAFIIVSNNSKDISASIEWLTKSCLTFTDLDADGKVFFISKELELNHWNNALEFANALHGEDYQKAPFLFHLAAMSNLVQAIPDELKSLSLQQIPFEAHNFPLASNVASLKFRRTAQDFFNKCAFAARELGCVDAANIAEDYALWLELRDPEGQDSGRQKLQESMRDSAHSLRRLHLALQFGLKPDLGAVEQEIERQTAISGGKSQVAAMARFALAFTQENPKGVAAYIDRHRAQLLEYLEKKSVNIIEIEMLSRAGLPQRAEERLRELIDDGLTETEQHRLRRIIAESTGADQIEARRALFESSGQLTDLIILVDLLEGQNEWSQLCHFGALLCERTQALADIERFARALNESNHYGDLLTLLRKYPDFLSQSNSLQMLWSWSLYYEGSLAESACVLEKLNAKLDHPNNRALAVNLAITSGDWDALLPYVEHEWANRDQRDTAELIKTAQIAQIAGSPRAKELMYAAVAKGGNNAEVFAAAYFFAIRAGWEEETTVAEWLHNAAELSDDSGPMQKMTLKDLFDRAPEWNRREAGIWQQLNDGNIPIFGFAKLMNRSLIDTFLLPALANPSEPDLRKRALIPAYSGVRQSIPCSYRVVAMEATALLTLGTLGLLDTVCNAFERILIPHSTLGWLFEEKEKVSFHQPSRVKNSSKIRHLLATGVLKECTGRAEIDTDLAVEIGEELASLIAEAQTVDLGDGRQRLVIRSSPVHRIGSLMEEEVDLSPFYPYLCSCLAVVNKLKNKGQLTVIEERHARSYLTLNEKEWPDQPEISDNAVLYLDDLSVTYLQFAGVLEKLRSAGFEVYVSAQVITQLNALLGYEQLTSEVSRVIESIRATLAAGIKSGKVNVGKIPQFDDEEETTPIKHHPTFAIVHIAQGVEAIFVDDRFLNQHQNFDNGSGPSPVLTTLDLLNALYSMEVVTFEQLLDHRTKLRQYGYLFIPLTKEELDHCLTSAEIFDGQLVETAELKAIRENLLRIRMSRFLQLPKEASWLASTIQVFSHTLKAQWHPDINEVTSRARSEWLLNLLDIRGWAHCYNGDSSLHIAEQGYGTQIMALFFLPSNIAVEVKEKYQEWIENRLLVKLQEEDPAIYSWMIKRAEDQISHAIESTFLEDLNCDNQSI